MAITFTSSHVNNGVARYWHTGVNATNVTWTAGSAPTSLSPSTVVQMVKVPNGAVILDVVVAHNFAGNTEGSIRVGDGSLSNRFVTTTSVTASSVLTRLNNAAGFGYTISVGTTVDAVAAFDTIDLQITITAGSETATASVQMTVYYLVPPYST